MSADTPEDWVLTEAAKLCGWGEQTLEILRDCYTRSYVHAFRSLCDMIQKYEQPPVDRKLLCAREGMAQGCVIIENINKYRTGEFDRADTIQRCIRAIELWEEGFGRD